MIEYGFNPLLTPTALALGLASKKLKRIKQSSLTGIGGDNYFVGTI